MATAFKIVAEFLDRFEAEVEGRSKMDPSAEVRAKIRAFARGELTEGDRDAIVALLRENPQWVPLLAEEVKALRSGTDRSGDSGPK